MDHHHQLGSCNTTWTGQWEGVANKQVGHEREGGMQASIISKRGGGGWNAIIFCLIHSLILLSAEPRKNNNRLPMCTLFTLNLALLLWTQLDLMMITWGLPGPHTRRWFTSVTASATNKRRVYWLPAGSQVRVAKTLGRRMVARRSSVIQWWLIGVTVFQLGQNLDRWWWNSCNEQQISFRSSSAVHRGEDNNSEKCMEDVKSGQYRMKNEDGSSNYPATYGFSAFAFYGQ